MKPREALEQEMGNSVSDYSTSTSTYRNPQKILLEVLLDIRDLLTKAKN